MVMTIFELIIQNEIKITFHSYSKVNNSFVDLLNQPQSQRKFYFSHMNNQLLSQSIDLSQLLSHKKNKNINSLMICQCPCRQQIIQNQKIIQLQSDYIKTLELQNLRRNQQRIYLEAEIHQLRLELEQPKKQKEQLLQKIRYYKGQYERAEYAYKQLELYMRNQQKQLMIKADQINNLKSNIGKIQLQNQMTQKLAKDLQQKLNKLYNQMEGRLPRERKNSIMVKKQYSSQQLVQNINKKWEQYCQEVKFKIHSEMMKEIQKYVKEIASLKNQKHVLQKKVQQLIKQIKNQKAQKNEIQRSYKNLQGSYKTIQEDHNNKIANYIQSNRAKLQQKIKDLQSQLLQQEMNQIKHSFSSEQLKLNNTTSSIDDIQKLQTQLLFQNPKTQNKEIQTSALIQSQIQTIQLQLNLQRQCQKLKQKDMYIQKLKQKLETMNKINQMIKSKSIQNQKSISRAESIQIIDNKKTIANQSQSINSIFKFLFSQYTSNAETADINIKKLQQIIKQKDIQIQSLQNANRLLKDMKMTNLQNSNKILQLQKQNHKLKRQLHQTKEGIIKSRGSNKSNNSNEENNNHLGLKIPSIPINSKSNLYRSFVQSKQDHLYRSQYQKNDNKTQLKTKRDQFHNSNEQERQVILRFNQKKQNKDLAMPQKQKQELPIIRMKITRVQSHEKLVKE